MQTSQALLVVMNPKEVWNVSNVSAVIKTWSAYFEISYKNRSARANESMSSECSSSKTRSSADGVNFSSCSTMSIGSWSPLSIERIALKRFWNWQLELEALRSPKLTLKSPRRSSSACSTELCNSERDGHQWRTEFSSFACCRQVANLRCSSLHSGNWKYFEWHWN